MAPTPLLPSYCNVKSYTVACLCKLRELWLHMNNNFYPNIPTSPPPPPPTSTSWRHKSTAFCNFSKTSVHLILLVPLCFWVAQSVAEFIDPWLGDKVSFCIGLSWSLAWRYDNPMADLTSSPVRDLWIRLQDTRTSAELTGWVPLPAERTDLRSRDPRHSHLLHSRSYGSLAVKFKDLDAGHNLAILIKCTMYNDVHLETGDV